MMVLGYLKFGVIWFHMAEKPGSFSLPFLKIWAIKMC